MPATEQPLNPAPPEDLEWTLSHALQFDGRKHFKASSELAAKITAAHLAECLRKSGFVVMKLAAAPVTPGCAYSQSLARVKAQNQAE